MKQQRTIDLGRIANGCYKSRTDIKGENQRKGYYKGFADGFKKAAQMISASSIGIADKSETTIGVKNDREERSESRKDETL